MAEIRHAPKIEDMDGYLMLSGYSSAEKVRAIRRLKLEPGDIVVSSYPKCGITWTQYIVWEILNDGAAPPTLHKMLYDQFPLLEFNGVDMLADKPHPWWLRMHLPYDYAPHHPQAKYIYIARNPKDCCTSFYPFLKQFPTLMSAETTFAEFFECFVDGYMPGGDYFDHVLSWYHHKDDKNVLFLTYEEMKNDPKSAIMNIAKFLGEEHERKLVSKPELFNKIVELTSFENMKKLPYVFPADPEWVKEHGFLPTRKEIAEHPDKFIHVDFFRKGQVGDWKNFFTEDMEQRLNDIIKKKLQGTYLYDLWKDN